MQALSTAVPGKWYTIKWMFGVPEVLNAMHNMSTGGAGKIKGIQNQRGQRNPCDPE